MPRLSSNEKRLLARVSLANLEQSEAYNLRLNGQCASRRSSENAVIKSKTTEEGLDIYIKDDVLFTTVCIPVILSASGQRELIYNDFYIGKNSRVLIVAGCGVENHGAQKSVHNGIHRFHLAKGAKVKYIEKHLGIGKVEALREINPVTEIDLGVDAEMEMLTTQIGGLKAAKRQTSAKLSTRSKLKIIEKISTTKQEYAYTDFSVNLLKDASASIESRSVAAGHSRQQFHSAIDGMARCKAYVSCNAIINDHAQVSALPAINARHAEAVLAHEASIGKIASDQLEKLMTLGLSQKAAEKIIINAFLN